MLVSLILCMVLSGNNLSLTLKSEGTVGGDTVYLDDVLDAQSYQRIKAVGVKNLSLQKLPSHVNRIAVRRYDVTRAVEEAVPNLDLDWKGPAHTMVDREFRELTQELVSEEIARWLEAQQPETGTLHLDDLRMPPFRFTEKGALSFDIRANSHNGLIGRKSLYLSVKVNDVTIKSLIVSIQTSLETMVAVAAGDLERGRPITEDAVHWELRRLDRIIAPLITPDDMDGIRTRTMVKAGDFLTTRQVERIPLVMRNQLVHVIVRVGNMTVRMQALAMDNGAKGESVRLKNVDSGQFLSARVSGPGETVLSTGAAYAAR